MGCYYIITLCNNYQLVNFVFADNDLDILISYRLNNYKEFGEMLMSETEFLKQKIKSEQEKLNKLLMNGEKRILALDETIDMSKELDKLIVEYHRLVKQQCTEDEP